MTATFTTYSPNRALVVAGGKCAWELAGWNEPKIIYDGINLVEKYNLDAAYVPHELNSTLIFVAKEGNQYFVVYDGEEFGPDFDGISVGYCCDAAGYTIMRRQGQYWFWGTREGEYYVVVISELD